MHCSEVDCKEVGCGCSLSFNKRISDMTIVIDRNSPEGNAFAIMGLVQRTLRQLGKEDRWNEAQEAMLAGDYNHLCETATAMTDGVIEFVN